MSYLGTFLDILKYMNDVLIFYDNRVPGDETYIPEWRGLCKRPKDPNTLFAYCSLTRSLFQDSTKEELREFLMHYAYLPSFSDIKKGTYRYQCVEGLRNRIKDF